MRSVSGFPLCMVWHFVLGLFRIPNGIDNERTRAPPGEGNAHDDPGEFIVRPGLLSAEPIHFHVTPRGPRLAASARSEGRGHSRFPLEFKWVPRVLGRPLLLPFEGEPLGSERNHDGCVRTPDETPTNSPVLRLTPLSQLTTALRSDPKLWPRTPSRPQPFVLRRAVGDAPTPTPHRSARP